jgi:hypothetical protein
MEINPIILIVTASSPWALAFVIAYKKSDTFRGIVRARGRASRPRPDGLATVLKPTIDAW